MILDDALAKSQLIDWDGRFPADEIGGQPAIIDTQWAENPQDQPTQKRDQIGLLQWGLITGTAITYREFAMQVAREVRGANITPHEELDPKDRLHGMSGGELTRSVIVGQGLLTPAN